MTRSEYLQSLKDEQISKAVLFIEDKGGVWVSGEYANGKSKIELRCSKGHTWTTRFEYIRQEKWCAKCAKEATALRTIKAAHLKRINKQIQYVKSPQYARDKINKQIYEAKLRYYATPEFKEKRRIRNRQLAKKWAKKQRPQDAAKYKYKYHNDMAFRLNERLKSQFRKCLIKDRVMGKYYELLGYTTEDLKKHLQSKFTDGMSWETIGEWHIDHIRPKSWYNLTNNDGSVNEHEVKKCWSLSNLQPLWATDNTIKSNRWEG